MCESFAPDFDPIAADEVATATAAATAEDEARKLVDYRSDFGCQYLISPREIQRALNTNVPCTFCNLVEVVDQHPGDTDAAYKFFVKALAKEERFKEKAFILIEEIVKTKTAYEATALIAGFVFPFFVGAQILNDQDLDNFEPKGHPYGGFDTPVASDDQDFPVDPNNLDKAAEFLIKNGLPADIVNKAKRDIQEKRGL